MRIGGVQKCSFIDYPGRVSAVIFTQGCNFRCPYCHNPELVLPERFGKPLELTEILAFLDSRSAKLGGVTVSGGEPTLQKDLLHCLRELKNRSFKVKLDTNGSQPRVLETVLKEQLADFIAMDIKAPLDSYAVLAGLAVETEPIKESLQLILSSGIDYQLRTTSVPQLLTDSMKEQIRHWMQALHARHIFQEFRPGKLLEPELSFLEISPGDR